MKFGIFNVDSFFFSGGTYETRNGMKEPDHFGDTVSNQCDNYT